MLSNQWPWIPFTHHIQGRAFATSHDLKKTIHLILKDKRLQDVEVKKKSKEQEGTPMDIGAVSSNDEIWNAESSSKASCM